MPSKSEEVLQLASDYKETFRTQTSRNVLADLMKRFSMLSPTYDGDVNNTLIREGGRQVILYILSQLNIDEGKLLKMIEEEKAVENRRPRQTFAYGDN
ncbi:MAG TPA: hypothetical protein VFS41_05115 [Edaphobacter sp.]|nr:hypothetical protein [Edaphobacter sp.]